MHDTILISRLMMLAGFVAVGYPSPVVSPTTGCTYTTYEPVPYPCDKYDFTETHYPSTATETAYIDCHGCSDVEVDKQLWYCGLQPVYDTITALTPTTTITTACSLSPTDPIQPRRPDPQNAALADALCLTTVVVQPSLSAGPTLTRYSTTATSTSQVPCGGCDLVVSTALLGPGPAGRFTTTVTSPTFTATGYACA